MKRLLSFATLFSIIICSFLYSCSDGNDYTITRWEPVKVHRSELMPEATFSAPQEISNSGKIYYKDQYLFITETNEGIHVINNEDPSHPTPVGFINLPGTQDLAAKGNYLYADSFNDLVILDLSDKSNISEVGRLENFNNDIFFFDDWYGQPDGDSIIIDYQPVEYQVSYNEYIKYQEEYSYEEGTSDFGESAGFDSGIGGSLARFTIANDYLYTVSSYQMTVFDISNEKKPEKGESIDLGWGIETIFPYQDLLFLGAQDGMHIYDNSSPAKPQHLSSYQHILSCDPVVVKDDIAYVTLRSGNNCWNQENRLEVVDVSNPREPKEMATYEMLNPHGLGVIDNCLFIAEGEHGIKLFNIEDPLNIKNNLIKHHTGIHALDVIPLPNVLMMIGQDGLVQYEYDCHDKLEQISHLSL